MSGLTSENRYKKGRPLKFNLDKQDEFCHLVSEGASRTAAAKQVGVAYQTVFHRMEKSQSFKKKVEDAERGQTANVINVLYLTALEGNINAIQFWLRSREPGKWYDPRKQQVEHSEMPIVRITYVDNR